MRSCFFSLLFTLAASGQPVSVGVKAGVPLTAALDASSPQYHTSTNRYALGPAIEFHLPWGLSLELDAIYKRFSYESQLETRSSSGNSPRWNSVTETGRWEFPVLLKYRFTETCARPFLGAGLALNRVTGTDEPVELRHRQALGFVLGGGVEFRWRVLRIAPEVRFTHWGERNFGTRGAPLHSNLDQADILVGLGFP